MCKVLLVVVLVHVLCCSGFEERDRELEDTFVFPDNHRRDGDSNGGSRTELASRNGGNEIDFDLAKEMNNYTDAEDFLTRFVEGYSEEEQHPVFLSERFGGEERSAAVRPKFASCKPELQTVRLSPNSSNEIYFPPCTRIERCGGCCSSMSQLFSCQPVETETVSFQVSKLQQTYNSNKPYKLVDKEIILVEKHIKCKCDCRIREEDCGRFQTYQKDKCRCVCRNLDEESKCWNNPKKIWNPDLCRCECREAKLCTTDTIFDLNQCRCIVDKRRRSAPEITERRVYRTNPQPVFPLARAINDYYYF